MRALAVAAAVAAAVATASPAHAGNDSFFTGQCQMAATPSAGTGQDVWVGVAGGAVVVQSVNTPGDNPVSATLTCLVAVNGAVAAITPTGSGTVVVPTTGLVTFVAAPNDAIELCTLVVYTSNATAPQTLCVPWP